MKLQVVSDLHLEFEDFEMVNAGSDVLILSGDIFVADDLQNYVSYVSCGNYEIPTTSWLRGKRYYKFIEYQCSQFEHVIMVMGNHEHYNGYYDKTYDRISDAFDSIDNFHILEKESLMIDGVNFLGCTLWTDFNGGDKTTIRTVRNGLNDYMVIRNYDTKKLFRVHQSQKDHNESLYYISNNIRKGHKNVVVGHHAPSIKSIHEKYANQHHMNGGYVSNLDEFILEHPDIVLWTHGHVHTCFDYMIGNTRVYCNPKGYHDENPDFKRMEIVEI